MKRLGISAILALLLISLLPTAAHAAQLLIPVGKVIGLQLRNNTVTVAAFDDTLGDCARQCGIRVGDTIEEINGIDIHNTDDVRNALDAANGTVHLTLRRGSRVIRVSLNPPDSGEGRRIGVYLRQGIAGLGTVTWYDPTNGQFGALGHGVNDSGGCLLKMAEGTAYAAGIQSVIKGKCGQPGQLRGSAGSDAPCGELFRNTPQGVFGTARKGWAGEPVGVAQWDELHTGSAVIVSTICGDTPREYSVEILKLYPAGRSDGRNLLLKVTDPELLGATGGIVQGMSGSPILQDGRLVGAVTHVLVNDPTMGYGIFIQNMLDAAA